MLFCLKLRAVKGLDGQFIMAKNLSVDSANKCAEVPRKTEEVLLFCEGSKGEFNMDLSK